MTRGRWYTTESALFGGAATATTPTPDTMVATAARHQNSNRVRGGHCTSVARVAPVSRRTLTARDSKRAPNQRARSQPNVIRWKGLSTSVIAVTASPHVTAAPRKAIRQRVTTPCALQTAAYATTRAAKQSTGTIPNIRDLAR